MSGPTNSAQILKMGGKPAFAVIPYDEYLRLISSSDADALIPHEVVGLVVEKGINLVKAWRLHLGLTQKKVASRAGISQAALSQMERSDNRHRTATLEKLATALEVSASQLTD
ncbi:MAG: helix-turn-helix transcriptional regulator [Desulfobacterales bacterium]|nr:helix-turn-helix transcriptional regulator [Desulfobacterales bacterium]